MTRLPTRRLRECGSIHDRSKTFPSFPKPSRLFLVSTQHPIRLILKTRSPGVKCFPLNPSSAEFKNGWIYTSNSLLCFRSLNRDKFGFFCKCYVILGTVSVVKHFCLCAHYSGVSLLSAVLHDKEETLVVVGCLCNNSVPSSDFSCLAIFMVISVDVLAVLTLCCRKTSKDVAQWAL